VRRRGSNRRDDGPAVALLGALAVLLVGLLLSVLGSRALAASSRQRSEERFRESANQARTAVEDQLRTYFNRVRNVGAFVASGRQPTTDDLRRYLAQDRTFEELPSLQSLLFVKRVDAEHVDAVRAQIDAAHPDSPPNQQAIPHAEGASYLVTDYIPGPSDFKLPVGADLSGLASVRALVDVSAQTGTGVVASFQNDPLLIAAAEASPNTPVQMVMDIDFFFAVPIFDTSGQYGFDHLIGWVAAPVAHFDEVLQAAGANRPADIGQSLTVEVQAPGTDETLRTRATAHVGTDANLDPEFTDEQTFDVLGVAFDLRTWSGPNASSDRTALAALLLGTITSILAAAVVFLRVRAVQGRTAMAAELEERRRVEHAIVESVASAMVVLDRDGAVVMGNRTWNDLAVDDPLRAGEGTGTSGTSGAPAGGRASDHVAAYIRQLGPASADVAGTLATGLKQVLAGDRASVEMDVPVDRAGERQWYAVRATPVDLRAGGAVVMHTDITERQRSADDLQRRASRDGLTGLLNRTSLEARADDLVAEAVRGGFSIGVLFIDLDDFKSVNDTYGHSVGDAVLRTAASAIERTVRPGDSIGRMGGDEFVVLLGAGANRGEVEAIAARVVFELALPRTIEGVDISIAASVGVAVVEDARGVDRAELIRRADEAMYAAKQSGGSRFVAADA